MCREILMLLRCLSKCTFKHPLISHSWWASKTCFSLRLMLTKCRSPSLHHKGKSSVEILEWASDKLQLPSLQVGVHDLCTRWTSTFQCQVLETSDVPSATDQYEISTAGFHTFCKRRNSNFPLSLCSSLSVFHSVQLNSRLLVCDQVTGYMSHQC